MGWRNVFRGSQSTEIPERSERLSVPRKNISDISHFSVAIKAELGSTRSWRRIMAKRPVIDLEAFEERAAIMEFDGGFPRAEAERLALLEGHNGTIH